MKQHDYEKTLSAQEQTLYEDVTLLEEAAELAYYKEQRLWKRHNRTLVKYEAAHENAIRMREICDAAKKQAAMKKS
ncbi:hypothetical protein LJC42_04125 [Eubacteriales bacterium OttesenSCG-928-K08]|nr:hypothetical protein [Eubacteriales bacterium OttesenSCG-928-K08]